MQRHRGLGCRGRGGLGACRTAPGRRARRARKGIAQIGVREPGTVMAQPHAAERVAELGIERPRRIATLRAGPGIEQRCVGGGGWRDRLDRRLGHRHLHWNRGPGVDGRRGLGRGRRALGRGGRGAPRARRSLGGGRYGALGRAGRRRRRLGPPLWARPPKACEHQPRRPRHEPHLSTRQDGRGDPDAWALGPPPFQGGTWLLACLSAVVGLDR
jgi:hypothetical protein